jgi:DnaJ domain
MNTAADHVRRAYAVFGLSPGAPVGQVRRRYKALARLWHPDRHASEARNQAEAAVRMREINAAYRCLADHLRRPEKRPATGNPVIEGTPRQPLPRGSLSRQQLDRLVESIGADGPVDWLLEELGWVGSAFRALLVGLSVVICIARVALLAADGAATIVRDPTLFLIVALLALLLLRELMERRKLFRP